MGDERASTRPERPFGDAEGARCAELANEMASALGVPTGQDAAKVLEAVERAAKPLAQARTEAGATSEVDLAAQADLRRAFDPRRLSNPDKVLPSPAGCGDIHDVPAGVWV